MAMTHNDHSRVNVCRALIGSCMLVLIWLHPAAPFHALAQDESPAVLTAVRNFDKEGVQRGGSVYDVAYSPDGKTALIGGDIPQPAMLLWNTEEGSVVRQFTPDVPHDAPLFVAYSPDGRLGAGGGLKGKVWIWDLATGAAHRSFVHPGVVTELVFSPDAQRLVTGGTDRVVRAWDVESNNESLVFTGHTGVVSKIAFLPNGQQLLTASVDKTVRLWAASDAKELKVLPHPDAVWSLAVSPDGRRVATGTGGGIARLLPALIYKTGEDNAIRIWDVESGQLVHTLNGHTHVVHGLAWDPTGKYIVSGGLDKTLRLWDARTGDELCCVNSKGWVNSVTFSPDGRFVLCGGGMHRDTGPPDVKIPEERVRLFRVDDAGVVTKPSS